MTPAAQPLQCAGRTSLSEAATGAPGGIGFLIRTGSVLPLVNHVPHWCHNLQVIIPPFFRRRPKIIISSWYSYDTPIKLYPRVYWLVKPCHVKPWWIPTVGPRASKQSIFTSWSVEMSMGDTPQHSGYRSNRDFIIQKRSHVVVIILNTFKYNQWKSIKLGDSKIKTENVEDTPCKKLDAQH